MPKREDAIRDYLSEHIQDLPALVTNLDDLKALLRQRENAFLDILNVDGGPTAYHLLQRVLLKRHYAGLEGLHQLRSLGTEFKLLSTGTSGKQPSADILSLNDELGVFYIPEVKQDVSAERQAITELSGYSQGLQNLFWGLAPSDHVWVPISTIWRTILREGMANQIVWGGRAVIPLRCFPQFDLKTAYAPETVYVKNLALEVVDLVEDLSETLCMAQFSLDCFDTLHVTVSDALGDPRSFVDFIVATASRMGLSGFVAYHEHPAMAFPYQFLIAATNPFRASLKQRQLAMIQDDSEVRPDPEQRDVAMKQDVGRGFWSWFDVDWKTGEIVEQSPDDNNDSPECANTEDEEVDANGDFETVLKEIVATTDVPPSPHYESLEVLAHAAGNRLAPLFRELKARFPKVQHRPELGSPHLPTLLLGGEFLEHNSMQFVGYFGVMREAIYERLAWEQAQINKDGSEPAMANLDGDPISVAARWETLFEFLKIMNFEHKTQKKFHVADEPDEEDDFLKEIKNEIDG